jgi:capsular polysaccharide biosynthesis protein
MNDMDDAARPDGLRHEANRPHMHPAPGPAPWNRSEAWNIPDDAPEDPSDPVRPLATLVSFHYLRAALRRRWRVLALFALLGVLLGAAFLAAKPPPRMATTTLRLAHQEQADPSGAIATDISLMTTRTVAERTIKALGLTMSPEGLMDSVQAVPSGSPEILQLTMSAPTDADAVRRLERFTKEYLNFRAKQISVQSDIMIKGYEDQIVALRSQAQTLGKRIESLAASGDTATDRLTDAVTEQSQVNEKIGTLQTAVDNATLRQKAIVSASSVIDPAAPLPPGGPHRRMVLVLASGLIGGLAIGFGVVVLRAILSDRLWLRMEVAAALNASVLLSVRRIAPLPRLLWIVRFLPGVRARDACRAVDRRRMAYAIAKAVAEPGHRPSLAVVCLGNSDEMCFGLVAAAVELQHHGRTATIVDLTEAGRIASAVARSASGGAEETPAVFRPRVVPSLAKGPTQIDSNWEDVALANARNRVTLILADLDPAVGVDHLTAWTDSVIVAMTAGRSSVELVRTTSDLVRSVDLKLRGAVLLGAVRDDMSSGIATPVGESGTETSEPAVSRPEESVGRSS